MPFLPCAGDGTIFLKMASPVQAKNRACIRGLTVTALIVLTMRIVHFLLLFVKVLFHARMFLSKRR